MESFMKIGADGGLGSDRKRKKIHLQSRFH